MFGEKQKLHDVPRPKRRRIGRRAHQCLADELRVASQVRLKAMHGVRVTRRVAFQFKMPRLFIVIGKEPLIAITEIDGAKVRHDQQAMSGEVEVAVYRLPHHAADIGIG